MLAEGWDGARPRLYLTGSVALEAGGVLVTERRLPGRQGRVVLSALVWERDRPHLAEELADIVWDGDPPGSWQVALRALMSKLRAPLADAGLTIEHGLGAYQIRLPADAWIDVEAANAAVHEAEAALRDGDLPRATGEALVANAIARRPFLHGDHGAWIDTRRAHLLEVRLRALSVRGRSALARGDTTAAIGDAELVVAADPYRETAYVLLMSAHAAAGNGAQAIAVYERLRTTLSEDLGVGPSPATEAVFLEVVRASS